MSTTQVYCLSRAISKTDTALLTRIQRTEERRMIPSFFIERLTRITSSAIPIITVPGEETNVERTAIFVGRSRPSLIPGRVSPFKLIGDSYDPGVCDESEVQEGRAVNPEL